MSARTASTGRYRPEPDAISPLRFYTPGYSGWTWSAVVCLATTLIGGVALLTLGVSAAIGLGVVLGGYLLSGLLMGVPAYRRAKVLGASKRQAGRRFARACGWWFLVVWCVLELLG